MPTPKPPVDDTKKKSGLTWVKFIYLYLMTLVGIVMLVVSTVGFLGLGLREYVFEVKDYSAFDEPYECTDDTLLYSYNEKGVKIAKYPNLPQTEIDKKKADCTADAKTRNEARHSNDVKREIAEYLAAFIVALPLYGYHWNLIKKDNKK